jgi:hypothetical protein
MWVVSSVRTGKHSPSMGRPQRAAHLWLCAERGRAIGCALQQGGAGHPTHLATRLRASLLLVQLPGCCLRVLQVLDHSAAVAKRAAQAHEDKHVYQFARVPAQGQPQGGVQPARACDVWQLHILVLELRGVGGLPQSGQLALRVGACGSEDRQQL